LPIDSQCRACGSYSLISYLDLGNQPLANNFLDSPAEQEKHPLKVAVCVQCWHSQLMCTVDPRVLYKNYLYVSGTTKTLQTHFFCLAHRMGFFLDRCPEKPRVLDIGSNDGSLLQEFKALGWSVQGVDPAENLAKIAGAKGIPTLVDYWSEVTWSKLEGELEVVTALNCLAHGPDPFNFLRGIKKVLAPAGEIILEFPLWTNSFRLPDFGQVYHEHYSYFTANSFTTLVERVGGLYIHDLEEFPLIHGGTVRFRLRRGELPHCQKLRELVRNEADMRDLKNYQEFQDRVVYQVSDLIEAAEDLLGHGDRIFVAYGASAKSSTLFNFAPGLSEYLDYIVDDAELKVGKYSPENGLKIYPTSKLREEDNPLILCTAHNFYHEIKQRLTAAGIHGTLLSYLPGLHVEEI
jgi:SAM-dependent methyltransferase